MAGPAEHCAADTEAQALFCCPQRVLAFDLDENQPAKIDAGLQPPMWVDQVGAMSATRSPTAMGRASFGQTRASSPRPDRALKISVRAASGQPSRAVSIERGVVDWLGAGVVDMGTLPAPHAAAIERESSATTLVATLSMLHARRGRRRASVFGEQDLQLRAHLEEICMQDGAHRLQREDMTPGP